MTNMSDQTLLSSLCSVCNIKESKYKCPGCSARTCSLPCVKRHKQWAQCSGRRDPTKYVKKSQLATPEGIDHDYNFLSGIERDLERSERSVTEKGLDVGLNTKHKGGQTQGFDHHLATAGVKVIHAPKGMSRARENKTHRSKSGNRNIIWTVEWIGEDKSRTLTQSPAVEPIYRLHPLFESPMSKKKKRKLGAEEPIVSDSGLFKGAAEPVVSESTAVPAASSQNTVNKGPQTQLPSPLAPSTAIEEIAGRDEPEESRLDTAQVAPAMVDRYVFYLLRPRTSSSRRVLIPLTSSDKLGDALRGCTVEEFPTIYYFPAATPGLPAEFMLDEDYRKEEGEEQREFEELMKEVDPEILRRLKHDETSKNIDDEVDSKKILDVLKQDLGSL